ncbi:hypothetical protein VOLCADRAFT_100726 [Volvox carteri f. nagariensis]|uniref:JmjC domain-containing protein n=1 Tax=Volvox carteri f. nagariensis TaxID=3068 RepID=D8UKV9_VOLCA|nr:uncharacterized protein VOLCADRAFT_100726 [Volvox carteri f. nagariensis]EFJ39633.1 hypothetical protein VOLCADRAFT_100726 [Volvox carteri f. nagariensis]|eukprot:XP_002959292.1 hypothetical protein VOLCADRAFT_100726 [Volvox carteri f. nagariensis]
MQTATNGSPFPAMVTRPTLPLGRAGGCIPAELPVLPTELWVGEELRTDHLLDAKVDEPVHWLPDSAPRDVLQGVPRTCTMKSDQLRTPARRLIMYRDVGRMWRSGNMDAYSCNTDSSSPRGGRLSDQFPGVLGAHQLNYVVNRGALGTYLLCVGITLLPTPFHPQYKHTSKNTRSFHSVKEVRESTLGRHMIEVFGEPVETEHICYMNNLPVARVMRDGAGETMRARTDAEALNPSRCDLVERLTSSAQASVPEVFGSDTFTDSGGVGARRVYHGSCQLACDMLVGSRHSRSCSHEDYPLQAPSIIVVARGRKIVWVAPGSFSQLLRSPACSMRQGKLLLDSMYNVTPSSLEDLVKEFGGAIYELGPGDGAVVPPGCVHAAYNTEPCLSINWTVCSQDQWAACLTTTSLTCLQTRKYGFRALARERLPQGSDTDIEALAADLEQKAESVAGSTDSVLGCHHFDRGFTSWIGHRLASDMSIVAAQKRGYMAASSRVAMVVALLRGDVPGLDGLLVTGPSAKWRKGMLALAGVSAKKRTHGS